jgi:uncharacterized C2H2 Zn-finger protein
MAQEILRICDPCMAENGVRSEARPIVLDLGTGPYVVDLCDLHEVQIVKPLTDAMALWGVVAEVPARKGKRKYTPRKPSITEAARAARSSPAEGETGPQTDHLEACPWCPYWVDNASSFRRHVTKSHGVSSFSAVVGKSCPVCGSVHQPRGVDSMSRHVEAAHGLPSVSRAVLAGRHLGDPFGVDAAVQLAEGGAG